MLSERFVVVASLVGLAGSSSYVWATLTGQTRPNRVTWALWGLAPLIAFAAQLSEGVGLSALMTLTTGLGPLAVVAASFANPAAYWALTRRDALCAGLSVLALVAWAVTRVGTVALALSILADFAAGVPTIAKAWRQPESETALPFALTATAAVITLAALPQWRFDAVAFPLVIALVSSTIFVLVRFPSRGPGRGRPASVPDPAEPVNPSVTG